METILISEAVGIRKPDAGIFKNTLANLSASPEQSWYVGDHPQSDMQGAAKAVIGGVWVRSGGHPWPKAQRPPDYTIDELPEILNLIGG
jgi:putative hydrolase of the HAD superfamily